jgi:hypothetical protein
MTVNVSANPPAPRYSGKVTAKIAGIPLTGIITFNINAPVGNYIMAQNKPLIFTLGSFGTTAVGFGMTNTTMAGAVQHFYNSTGTTSGTIDLTSKLGWTNTFVGNYNAPLNSFGNSTSFSPWSMMFANGVYYVGGEMINATYPAGAAYLIASTDGITWTTRNSALSLNNASEIQSLAYLSTVTNKYVAAAGGTFAFVPISSSTDGITWTTRNPGFGTSSINAYIVGGNGIYLAVAAGNVSNTFTINTSTDAVTWTVRNTNTFGTTKPMPTSIVYAAGQTNQYIVTGYTSIGTPLISSSTDGITWTTRTVPYTASANNLITGAIFGNSVYVAGGYFGSTTANIITSTDGATWTTRVSNLMSLLGTNNYISFVNGFFTAVSDGGYQQVSTDSITWTVPASTAKLGGGSNNMIVYGTSGLYLSQPTPGYIYTAYNLAGDISSDYGFIVEGPGFTNVLV